MTEIIIRDAHERAVGHCGVNATLNVLCQRFWILNAKVAVRQVISTCVTRKRVHLRMQNQIMADLPPARFQISEPPFYHTEVDLFGPLTVKGKRSNVKRYGCLFTCMSTRPIHLDLAYDLSNCPSLLSLIVFEGFFLEEETLNTCIATMLQILLNLNEFCATVGTSFKFVHFSGPKKLSGRLIAPLRATLEGSGKG